MDDTPVPIAELEQGPSKFEVFLERNQKLLTFLAIAVFLGVLGYVGYTSYDDYAKSRAGKALLEADTAAELKSVVKDFGNTASAGSADLLLADLKSQESSQEAVALLRHFVERYPQHPAIPSATTNLGLRLLNEGKWDAAKAELQSVLDMEQAEFIIPLVQIALGDIAKQQNDLPAARQWYTKVSELGNDADNTASFSAYIEMSKERVRFLNVVPPEVQKKKAAVSPTEISPNEKKDENNSQLVE